MNDDVSARGERAAMGGYMPQFSEFAWFAYRELVDNQLEWIRIADPKAQKLDDIQYATLTEIHAYQVKWTISEDSISFTDFKNLLPSLVSSWQGLMAEHQTQRKNVFAHLLTNRALSKHDRITHQGNIIGTFAEFFNQVWRKLKVHQPYDSKWQPVVDELITASGLNVAEFTDFVDHFNFHPAHEAKYFSVTHASYRRLDDDLEKFRSYILEKVGDASRPVEIRASQIIHELNWEARFKTTFNHELFVDQQKYQPITSTLQALDAKMDEYSGGYLFLSGAPGTGKSTLLTQWTKNRKERVRGERVIRYYAFDFSNPASPGNYHKRGDSTALFFDLVFQLKAERIYNENILPYWELHYLRLVFYKQLELLGEEFARNGRRTILLIDGLDHVPREYRRVTNSFLCELPLPASIPDGVFIILGSQSYELEDLSQELKAEWRKGDRTLTIDALDREAVFHYAEASDLQPPLTTEQKQTLFEKSQGHPLYLSYLVERIQDSADREAAIAEFAPIQGNIDIYYRNIWQPITSDDDVVVLLGLIARINGPINLNFIREWRFIPAVLAALNRKAKPLFHTTPNSWSFFHNSFRQFLLHQTALDPLTGEYSNAADSILHRQLADYYEVSKAEPSWHSIFHLYQAGESERFLQVATPANFVDHLLHFRPEEEIKRDLRLGIELASRTRDIVALTRYALAFSELESRLRHVNPADFVDEFLQMGKPELARRCLRVGSTLHTNQTYALTAARKFYDYGDRAEAAMLFTLAEPTTIRTDAIVIDESDRFDDAQNALEAWVSVAVHFRGLPQLLALLNNIRIIGDKKHRQAHENEVSMRLVLLQYLAYRAVALQDWVTVDAVLAEFNPLDERRTQIFFGILQAAIEGALHNNNQKQAGQYLGLVLQKYTPKTSKDTLRIYVANLIYQVMGDIPLVRTWLDQVPQPTRLGKELADLDDSFDEFEPFIVLNKLLNLCGVGVPITVAVPDAAPGTEDELLVEFLRMIGLTTQILADGIAGKPTYDIIKRVRPIVRFYYRNPSHHHHYWYRLTRIKRAYFDFLVSAVASLGPQELNQLADYFFHEFAANPNFWPPDSQCYVMVELVENGYESSAVKPRLSALKSVVLEGKDIDGRVKECRAQAQAWLAVGELSVAEHWLQQALYEAAGIGYRSDYQLDVWLKWLQQVNNRQPEQAPDRIRWFLARLPHLRDITEGGTYWRASEALLETALAWNFSAGQQQLQWQLQQGLIDFDGALETFITSYLSRTATAQDYQSILHFYTNFFLVYFPTLSSQLLTTLLKRGFIVLGEQLFTKHLPHLIDSITLHALEEKRSELLEAIEKFVSEQGHIVNSYYPGFTVPTYSKQESSSKSSNTLTLQPDHRRMSEEEALASVVSFEDLLALLAQEDAGNSSFNWSNVLEKLAPSFSADQIEMLANSKGNTRRNSQFFSALSKLAWQLGDNPLARHLADRAVQASDENGWVKGYDGGTRLQAFEAMKRIDPAQAMQRAFHVFGHDLANTDNPSFYIKDLDDILPLLTEKFGVEMIWDEVVGYLERMFANSKPIESLPALVPGSERIESVLVDLIGYLARLPVESINRSARTLLATIIAQNNEDAIRLLQQFGQGTEAEAEIFADVLMVIPSRVALVETPLRAILLQQAISKNYFLRRMARQILTEASIPLPTPPTTPLPAIYEIQFGSSKPLSRKRRLDLDAAETTLFSRRDLVSPYDVLIDLLAEQTGLDGDALCLRVITIVEEIQGPGVLTDENEQAVRKQLIAIRLKYNCTRPRAAAVRRALMHLITELLDSGKLGEQWVAANLPIHDYMVDSFPQVVKPAFIHTLKRGEYSHTGSNWVHDVQAGEPLHRRELSTYQPDWTVIGEYSLVRSLHWGTATETCIAHLTGKPAAKKQKHIFELVLNQRVEDYHSLVSLDSHHLIVCRRQLLQHLLKSQWLAFNPSLAIQLGWQPEPSQLFGWKDQTGNLMVKSVYWVNGNIEMPPPRLKSEAGEGWLVVATDVALAQLLQLGKKLYIEKRLTRSYWEQQRQEYAEDFASACFPYSKTEQ